MAEILVNGDFATNLVPWNAIGLTSFTWQSPGYGVAVVPANTSTDPFGHYIYQMVNLTEPLGDYRVRIRAQASQPMTLTIGMSAVATIDVTTEMALHEVVLPAVPGGSGVAFILGMSGVNANLTVTLDDVSLELYVPPPVVTATVPDRVGPPVVVTVTGLAPGQIVIIYRVVGTTVEKRASSVTADPSGVATWRDFHYPFGTSVVYTVNNADETEELARSEPVSTPDSLAPWIRDTVVPDALAVATVIVDITQRLYGGRVSVYRIVSAKYPVTIGDIRQASEGRLTLLCRSHDDRDRTIATLSTGNPCSLRVPAACRSAVDDMYFTPLDIAESRFGQNGMCLLDVSFVEVEGPMLPEYRAVSYASQTSNATTNDVTYAVLAQNFLGRSYVDLFFSSNGITP